MPGTQLIEETLRRGATKEMAGGQVDGQRQTTQAAHEVTQVRIRKPPDRLSQFCLQLGQPFIDGEHRDHDPTPTGRLSQTQKPARNQ